MPREQIKYPITTIFDENGKVVDTGRAGLTQPVPDGGSEHTSFGLAMGWGGNYPAVQVIAQVPLETLKGILKGVKEGTVTVSEGLVGIYVDIDRQQANSLVRTTRRARNTVFGSDE